ncbi:MAG: hypothetical protein JWM86_241 [Thermoleophilia bacterium]|nr:hypothetical protein [Thermoleophilia bacterium]
MRCMWFTKTESKVTGSATRVVEFGPSHSGLRDAHPA